MSTPTHAPEDAAAWRRVALFVNDWREQGMPATVAVVATRDGRAQVLLSDDLSRLVAAAQAAGVRP